MAIIYRAINDASDGDIKYPRYHSRRIPKNIPYLVDNLWEWNRPPGYADRRQCAYGSLSPAHARKYGTGDVYALEFLGDHQICQLRGYPDAKFHPDVNNVKEAVFEALGGYEWSNRTLTYKVTGGCLYIPGLSAEEVEEVLTQVGLDEADKKALRGNICFWEDVSIIQPDKEFPDSEGEIFFTYPDGYMLRELDKE